MAAHHALQAMVQLHIPMLGHQVLLQQVQR